MTRQLEMDLNDPKHPMHVQAAKVIEIADKIKDLTNEKGEAIDKLVELMQEHKKYSITIHGITLLHKKREMSTGVQIIRPK